MVKLLAGNKSDDRSFNLSLRALKKQEIFLALFHYSFIRFNLFSIF